jgi:hypothetical protein
MLLNLIFYVWCNLLIMKHFKIFTLLLVLNSSVTKAQVFQKFIVDNNNNTFVSDLNRVVKPGDTIELKGGIHTYIQFRGLHGLPGLPITIINEKQSIATFNKALSPQGYVMNFMECSNVVLTGRGNGDLDKSNPNYYGIQFDVDTANNLLGLSKLTTDFTVERIYFNGPNVGLTKLNEPGPAISVKTAPECNSDGILQYYYGDFTLSNLIIKDNLIENSGSEGIYAGYTATNKEGVKLSSPCLLQYVYENVPIVILGTIVGYITKIDTVNQTVYSVKPHMLKNVQIHHNSFKNTGWDAIQVNWACDVDIYNNEIYNYGTKNKDAQNNYVEKGSGFGFYLKPDGNVDVFNNVLIETNQYSINKASEASIYFNDQFYIDEFDYLECMDFRPIKKFNIFNNLVYRPYSNGIRIETNAISSTLRRYEINVANNLLVSDKFELGASSENLPVYMQKFRSSNSSTTPSYYFNNDALFGTNRNNIDRNTVYNVVNRTYSNINQLNLSDISSTNKYHWNYTPTTSSPYIDKAIPFPLIALSLDFYEKSRLYKISQTGPITSIQGFPKYSTNNYLDMGPVEFLRAIDITLRPSNESSEESDETHTMSSVDFSFYPNPAKNILNIDGNIDNINNIILVNLLGQSYHFPLMRSQLDINNLPVGIYQIRIELKSGQIITKQLVKNEN